MSDKKWYENIPENGVLCKYEKEIVCCIHYNKDFNRVTDSQGEAWFPEHLTPLTAQEWWDFAPWQEMDSAPNNTPIFVRYDDGLVSIEMALNWAVRKNIVAWLPLPGDL